MMEIFGQIIGFVAMGISFVIYQQKKRSRVIALKLLTDILWVLNFIFLGGYTGAMTSGVSIAREIVFFNNDKKWAKSRIWLFFFVGCYIASSIITAKNIFGIFPATASVLATFAFWNKNVKNLKMLSVPVSVCMLTYNLYCFSIAGIINEILTLSSIFISLLRKKST